MPKCKIKERAKELRYPHGMETVKVERRKDQVKMGPYLAAYAPEHPRANPAGYVLEHILVMEAELGRPIELGEVVHHRDGNGHNNDPSNLRVFPSNAAHLSWHRIQRRTIAATGLSRHEAERLGIKAGVLGWNLP
jgi:hypothetical protein